LTPATLIGVSGCPIRALAVSTDNEGVFVGDQSSESGAAQKSAVAAIIPSALSLFIIATPSPPRPLLFKIEMLSQRIFDVNQGGNNRVENAPAISQNRQRKLHAR
jgi:hypothetical protein